MTHSSFLELCCIVGSVFLASNLWFFFRVLHPLQKLSAQAELLSQGEFDSFEHQCGGIPEIRKLQRAMHGMVGHVRRAQEQRRAYSEQLADGQETERKRLARELHDDTIQSIIAVTQGIDMSKNWIKTDPDRASQMLHFVREQAVEVVTNLRNLIGGLRPPALEELGLIPALEMQLNTITDIESDLSIQGESRRLDESQELALFRAAQEALYNVVRHSGATHTSVVIGYQPNGVHLTIQDNGQGFCLPQNLEELAFKKHYGLLGIQERIHNLDGWMKIDSQLQRGTTVEVFVPSQIRAQPENLVRDPVCSAWIEPQRAYSSFSYQGQIYYFCCPVCEGSFQKDPDLYLNRKSTQMPEHAM